MGTQVTILLNEFPKNGIPQLIKRLEGHFNTVTHHQPDFVIICKANKDLDKRQVQDICTGFSEIIENIHVHPCADIPDNDLREQYGFVTADKYRG